MTTLLEELDAKHIADAQEKIKRKLVWIEQEDGRPHVYLAYNDADVNRNWGARFGPFADNAEAEEFIAAGSFIASYRKGHGVLKVGYRVRYVGKNRVHESRYVEDCPIGTEAVITHDNGYDYRYTLTFDRPTSTQLWSRFPDGQHHDVNSIRTSGSGWERVFPDNSNE